MKWPRPAVALVLATGVLPVLVAGEARAQGRILHASTFTATFVSPRDAAAPGQRARPAPVPDVPAPAADQAGPSKLMLPFYVATAVVQALDVDSSFSALDAGAKEANPLLLGIVPNRPAFVAVKAAMTAAIIYGASRLAKRHRAWAIVALVGINAAYAALASHNYHVAAAMRARYAGR